MRAPGPILSPLLRVAASLLLICVLSVALLGGAASAPRALDPLAERAGSPEGMLVQTLRLKPAKPAATPPAASADPEVAPAAAPEAPRRPEGARQRATPARATLRGSPASRGTPIRAPPRAL